MKHIDFSDLKSKVCVITGGAGIIGRAICDALAGAGIKTAILDLNGGSAKKLASELTERHGITCLGVQADVLERESLEKAEASIRKDLGDIDFLINGAGGNSPDATTSVEQIRKDQDVRFDDTFFGLDLKGFDKVFALNFTGTLLPTMVFSRDMVNRGKGVILNISSMNSFRPLTKIPAYSAAKASINNFTQWLAVHEKTGQPTPRGNKIILNTPTGHYGQPEDLQGAVLFLLSEISSFITGVVLPVDGGYSAYGGV
jgi:NAD(P)-dependent dehydrogenase (short-subunit alcohol dehydrogenase family)